MASPISAMDAVQTEPASNVWGLTAIALTIAAVHLLTNGRYGFHRDELQTLSDALHLDWGFVAYPPFTPVLERIGMASFGISLVGLRLFSVIAQSAAILITGMMARELGGSRWAQATAALATAVAPLSLFEGTEFQYSSFDYLWWVLIAYFVVRLLKSEDARWCVAIGGVVGLGLLTKYTMAFYAAGVLIGLLLTNARRYFVSRWFWTGMALALLLALPNFLWQVRHDFISLHFLQSIHKRDVAQGRAQGYWTMQFLLDATPLSVPLWVGGIIGFWRSRRYRTLFWMYVVPVATFWLTKARFYYPTAVYPMLFAMGAVVIEHWLTQLPPLRSRAMKASYLVVLALSGVAISAILIPWQSRGRLRDFALKNNGDLREEIGWEELAGKVAAIRDSLPAEQRSDFGIFVWNYGEQGAIEILGRRYNLPAPISVTNSAWLRGYPATPPSTLIVLGASQKFADRVFTGCRIAGHNDSLGVENEESKSHPDIFVCGAPRLPWPEFWKTYQSFG